MRIKEKETRLNKLYKKRIVKICSSPPPLHPHLQTRLVTLKPLDCFHVLGGESAHYSLVLLRVFFQLLQSCLQLGLLPAVLLTCFIELTRIQQETEPLHAWPHHFINCLYTGQWWTNINTTRLLTWIWSRSFSSIFFCRSSSNTHWVSRPCCEGESALLCRR